MARLKIIVSVLVAGLALGMIAASTAQALTAPFWSIGGTRLVAGKTHNITGKVYRSFTLSVPADGVVLSCSKETVERGVLTGSEVGQPGSGTGVLALSGCVLEAGNGAPECKVAETQKTVPVSAKLVENVEAGGGGKRLLVLFKPLSGNVFSSVLFEGAACEVEEAKLTGAVVAEVLTDPGEEVIELGQARKEAHSWLERFPSSSIREVWLVAGGTGKVAKLELSTFGESVALTGTALGSLANAKFEPEEVNWSPLP